MQLLPALFPNTRFEFRDVIERKGNRFHQQVAAQVAVQGEMTNAKGLPMSQDAIAGYTGTSSGDTVDPLFTSHKG